MMLGFLTAAAALATQTPQANGAPLSAASFILTRNADHAVSREQATLAPPVPPPNMDLRDFAIDAPELVLPLAENGPRLLLGAFGGRGKGMPKLAHVGLGWTF